MHAGRRLSIVTLLKLPCTFQQNQDQYLDLDLINLMIKIYHEFLDEQL